jgi:hypothetical protein
MGELLEEVEQYLKTVRKKEAPSMLIPLVILIIGAFLVWTFVLKK